jgi:hypothetical protein
MAVSLALVYPIYTNRPLANLLVLPKVSDLLMYLVIMLVPIWSLLAQDHPQAYIMHRHPSNTMPRLRNNNNIITTDRLLPINLNISTINNPLKAMKWLLHMLITTTQPAKTILLVDPLLPIVITPLLDPTSYLTHRRQRLILDLTMPLSRRTIEVLLLRLSLVTIQQTCMPLDNSITMTSSRNMNVLLFDLPIKNHHHRHNSSSSNNHQ